MYTHHRDVAVLPGSSNFLSLVSASAYLGAFLVLSVQALIPNIIFPINALNMYLLVIALATSHFQFQIFMSFDGRFIIFSFLISFLMRFFFLYL